MRYDVIDNTVSVVQVFDITPNYLYYTEKYAYYTHDKTKEIGKFKETGENLKLSDTVIYRLDYTSDTPVPEKVFEFPAEMSTYSMDRFVVSGNYLYGYYVTWGTLKEVYTSDDGYNSKDDDIIMRIDLRNGEIYYIEE